MKEVIFIMEEEALAQNKLLSDMVLDKYMEGYVLHSIERHSAVGSVYKLVTVEWYAQQLAEAINNRDRAIELAVSAHESQQEGGE